MWRDYIYSSNGSALITRILYVETVLKKTPWIGIKKNFSFRDNRGENFRENLPMLTFP